MKKSLPHFIPDYRAMIGPMISSVTPGYTVDSRTTMAPFFRFCPTIFDADSTGFRSGSLALVTGVGTPIMTKSACLIVYESVVASILLPGVSFSSSMAFLVSPVPDRPHVPGKCFGKGEANIAKTYDTDRFVEK